VADRVADLHEGVALASGALDTGRAKRALATLVEVSHSAP
jgi:anthranilate phosphoribosyltransferase